MASPLQTLKEFVSRGDDASTRPFMCNECDSRFTSAKQPRRARCPECLDADVEPLESR